MSEHYDSQHQRTRAVLVRQYEASGRGWPCHLCGRTMNDPPRALDLAHSHNRQDARRDHGPRGLAHRACNRGDALALGNRRRGRRWDPRPRAATPRPEPGSGPAVARSRQHRAAGNAE